MSNQAHGPLHGTRVIDLTTFLSGPFCTQILGDLGADVIKLEPPEGDSSRHIPPHFVAEDSAYFLSVNRNKRSLALDLKTSEGKAVLRELVLSSDVCVENFRPGVLARLGVSEAEMRAQRPDLVWCSISGFGQNGPYRDKPAYDMVVQALSGAMSLTGEPGGKAVRAGVPIGDLAAGMYAVMGILAALFRRTKGGGGNTVDISMLDCQAALLSYQAAYFLHSGRVPDRQGSGHDSIATYRSFVAGDGKDVVVTANTERMWQGLCRALGLPELVTDPRFATGRTRHENRLDLWPLLETAFLERGADDWVLALEAEAVPVAIVNTLDRAVADKQIEARGMVLDLASPDRTRRTRVMGDPIALGAGRRASHSYPPALGENSAEILSELLDYSPERIDALLSSGVVVRSRERALPA